MEDGSNVNAGHLIPGDEDPEMKKQDDLFSRGWSKTGKRKEKSTRARVKIITGFFQNLPVKKRKMSNESPRGSSTGDHRHSPSSGSRIFLELPGELMENDGVGVTVASDQILKDDQHVCNRSLHDNDKAENIVIFTEEQDGSASRRSPEYCENQPLVALDFDLNEPPPEWIPDE